MLRWYLESLALDRRRLLSRYRIVDAARNVVGVGSVDTAWWLTTTRCSFEFKEAQPSVLQPYVSSKLPFPNEGRRFVLGQRLTQGSPDISLA
jgi:hypothetical protein